MHLCWEPAKCLRKGDGKNKKVFYNTGEDKIDAEMSELTPQKGYTG